MILDFTPSLRKNPKPAVGGYMPEPEKMLCPNCGVQMNHHADKIDFTPVLTETDAADSDLGGILEEVHTCPKCGQTAVKRAN